DRGPLRDGRALLDRLYRGVFDLAPALPRRRIPFLPARTELAA
ncbi:glycerol acyltransferase, partial [Mesorhizobium sp. M7A.F.Ca.CA.001.08.1.1]